MNYVYDDGGVYIKNLANCAEKYGISQYRFPHNYELVGRDFTITAGDKEYKLAFKCKKNVVFEGKEYAYECLKLELNTYFVCFGFNVAVVDVEQCLVTLILGDEYIYGNIGCPDQKYKCGCSQASHGCAGDDMVGTNVAWILGCGRFIAQDFYGAGKCSVAWSPRENEPYEQPCKATRIKGPIYLVDIKGRVHRGVCAPFFTNRVIMLQDYDHMMTVGCVMGQGFDPIMISGYAKFLN
jgi:hypothetical protein